jgi:GTP-binding protein
MLTLAIIGRPNTGKSTLFNRLVGRRVAITLMEPGTTRDRIIQQGEWLTRKFWVIDTGGLVPTAQTPIEKEIEIQVELAIQEADIALLLVDAREGLNPVDIEIADRLKRRKTRFLLVVNKVDNPQSSVRESEAAEFYRLGTDRLFPISAEHGHGVDELLDYLFEQFPESPTAERQGEIRLAILGRPNVGKSSLLNALLGEYRSIVHDVPGTTRDVVEATFELEGQAYRIVDTAGIRRKSRVDAAIEYFSVLRAIRTIDDADVAIFVLDVRAGVSAQDKHIAALIAEKGRGLVICANKADLLSEDSFEPVQDWLREVLPYIRYVPIVFTSAKENRNVQEVVRAASRVFEQGQKRISKQDLKEQLLEVFIAAPPRKGAQVRSVKQTGVCPPEFKLAVTDPRVINEAYLKFVEREIRRLFGFEGYPMRIKAGR